MSISRSKLTRAELSFSAWISPNPVAIGNSKQKHTTASTVLKYIQASTKQSSNLRLPAAQLSCQWQSDTANRLQELSMSQKAQNKTRYLIQITQMLARAFLPSGIPHHFITATTPSLLQSKSTLKPLAGGLWPPHPCVFLPQPSWGHRQLKMGITKAIMRPGTNQSCTR